MASLLARKRTRRSLLIALAVLAGVVGWQALRDRTETYVPGEFSEGLTDALGRRLPSDHPPLLFVNVTAASGLIMGHFPGVRSNRLPEDMGSGVALGDADGDGDTDAYLVNARPLQAAPTGDDRSRLFLNDGRGSFVDATDASGAGLSVLGMSPAFFDREGDGDLDLFVSAYGGCTLLDNSGPARFTDVTDAAGVGGHSGFLTGIATGDPDLDGDIDVYVCGYVHYDEAGVDPHSSSGQYGSEIPALINPSAFEPERNLFFVNRGDGTFDEAAVAAGVDDPRGRGLGALFCDLTGDGLPDLYVANDVSDNVLYVNRGDGRYDDVTARALVGDYRGAMGLGITDVEGDGDPDLFITHWVAQENALYVNISGDLPKDSSGPPVLFMDEADKHGLGQAALPMVGWAASFADFDSDGLLDLHVVNGHTIPLRDDRTRLTPQRDQLFWNAGPGRGFFELSTVAGEAMAEVAVGRGGAAFDLELDGDPDLLLMVHGDGPRLLRNDTPLAGRSSLLVRARQPSGNTFALGARLELTLGDSTQVRWLGSQGSYLSQHAVGEELFGLGGAPSVERLTLTWPDGESESLYDLPADRLLTWVRGQPPVFELLPGKTLALRAAAATPPSDAGVRRRFHELHGQAMDARVADNPAAAAELCRQALALWPDHDGCSYDLANSLSELGDEDAARMVLERLVLVHPESSRAWMQLGRLHLPGGAARHDDLPAARAAFERSLSINGEETGPLVQLGLVALLQGRLVEAEELLGHAAATNVRDVPSRYFGGYLAWRRGDAANAERLLQAAQAADAGTLGKGHSASAEGDTKTGKALTAAHAERGTHPVLDRWRGVGARGPDLVAEYAPLSELLGL